MDSSTRELLETFRCIERASVSLRQAAHEEDIFYRVADAFRSSESCDVFIFVPRDHGRAVRLVATSADGIELGERIVCDLHPISSANPDLASGIRHVLEEGETIRVPFQQVSKADPSLTSRTTVLSLIESIGAHGVLTPLRKMGRIVGVLAMVGSSSAEHHEPLIVNLAHHLCSGLESIETRNECARVEKSYQDLLENLNEIVYAVDSSGLITYISPAVRRFGYEPEELMGEPFDEILQGRATSLRRWFLRCLRGQATSTEVECPLRTKDGDLRWLRFSTRFAIDEEGKSEVRGTASDVTNEHRSREALLESERQLSMLMANLPGMVYRCRNDRVWTMEFVSEGGRELTGYTPEDLVHNKVRSFGSLIHPEDRVAVRTAVQSGLAEHTGFRLSYRIHTAEGEEKWVWEQGRGIRDARGNLQYIEGFISDITEQRATEKELQRNRERLELALEATSDGLWDWHIPTGRTHFSDRYYGMLGYEPGEFPQTYEAWASRLHPDDRDVTEESIRTQVLRRQGVFAAEFRMRAKNGSWHWILGRGRVVERDRGGQPVRFVGTHVDITARKDNAAALSEVLNGTIRALAETAETRDPYTAGHQQRVARLSIAVAQELGWTEDAISGLRVAALLHDVGKIAVPSEILSKPGILLDSEMALVRIHVNAGCRILAGIEFPWPVVDMVRQHHERLDGSGYPEGLQTKDISMSARILAVADVVEAMSSHRPYRPSLGMQRALEEVRQGRGTRFDKKVVDACLTLFRSGQFSFEGSGGVPGMRTVEAMSRYPNGEGSK